MPAKKKRKKKAKAPAKKKRKKAKTRKQHGLETIGVKELATSKLIPNPHNPRMLFDRLPLKTLRESIDKVGILVPLTVYQESRTGRFIILDGQRRWICAGELGIERVPVNQVREPSLVQNIVTMFQIHKLREDWELMPTALKLQLLIKKLDERNDRKLAELTGLDRAVVARCKKLLTYAPRYQDMMLVEDPDQRIKADFFIELYAVRNDRMVNGFSWFNRNKFTDRMLKKYLSQKGIRSVTDFRIMKQHLTNARKAKKVRVISRLLREFTEQDELTLDHLVIPSASVSAGARRVLKTLKGVEAELRRVDAAEYLGEEEFWSQLETLYGVIRRLLRSGDRRLK